MEGIDAETFNADGNNTIAFVDAVSMAIPPLTSDNIMVFSVEDVIATVRHVRKLTEEDSIDIGYSVVYSVAETGYNDAQTAYDALNDLLTVSIVDNDLFNGYLQVSASNNNAPDLLSTTSKSYSASSYEMVGTDDDSKPNTRNHHKLIVGLVVGLGGGLLLIGLIYLCIFHMGESSDSPYDASPERVNNERAFEMTAVDPTAEKAAV